MIAALIRILVIDLGKTVLLTSYTHSAVDTILAKMKGEGFGILRLGNVDKVGCIFSLQRENELTDIFWARFIQM